MDNNPYATSSDEDLLILLRNDDRLAFSAIYDRYYKDAYRYLYILVKVPEIAEDLSHEAFLKIWEVRQQLKIDRSFKGYLFRLCHNKAVDMHKKIAAEQVLMDRVLQQYHRNPVIEEYSQKQLEQYDALVEKALDSLSPQRRKVFEMCKKQKKSYEEVARELHISPNTVKAHMSTILSLLRNFILERRDFFLIFSLLCECYIFFNF
jgi:RNA polymerase sigma-70 factor (family 1)